MSLTKIEGTLLYYFDKDDTQLIISLSDDINERIKIETRGEENYLSLFELCDCSPCKYKLMSLNITINDIVEIQCNQRQKKLFYISKSKSINKAYPVIKTFDKFQAAIWLVNTPHHGEYYPNNAQLAGCIHEILFNNQQLNMTINGPEITNKCPIKCIKNVCNFGVCYETFDIDPICDCTDTFLNGPYCNSSEIDVINTEHYPNSVQFKLIKITWRTDSRHIFGIWNENINMTVQSEGNHLYILYSDKNILFDFKKIIPVNYQSNQNASLYLSFDTQFIEIKLKQNDSTTNVTIYALNNLSKQHFTSISVPNQSSFIDFVYKSSHTERKWKFLRIKSIIKKNEAVLVNVSMNSCNRTNDENMDSVLVDKNAFWILVLFLVIIIILNSIYFAYKCYRKKIESRIEIQMVQSKKLSLASAKEDVITTI